MESERILHPFYSKQSKKHSLDNVCPECDGFGYLWWIDNEEHCSTCKGVGGNRR